MFLWAEIHLVANLKRVQNSPDWQCFASRFAQARKKGSLYGSIKAKAHSATNRQAVQETSFSRRRGIDALSLP